MTKQKNFIGAIYCEKAKTFFNIYSGFDELDNEIESLKAKMRGDDLLNQGELEKKYKRYTKFQSEKRDLVEVRTKMQADIDMFEQITKELKELSSHFAHLTEYVNDILKELGFITKFNPKTVLNFARKTDHTLIRGRVYVLYAAEGWIWEKFNTTKMRVEIILYTISNTDIEVILRTGRINTHTDLRSKKIFKQ